MRQWFAPRPAPLALRPDSTVDEVVAHLNSNSSRIQAWQADRVKVSARGAPFSGAATIKVERPKNLRVRVAGGLNTPMVDIGSNSEEYWFWNRESEEKLVFVAYHDEETIEQRQQRFPVPFEPEWVMEALGVSPIDPAEVRLEPGAQGSNTLLLVSERTSPRGRPMQKITEVDLRQGCVRQHVLRDEHGQLVARAVLSGYVPDRNTRAMLPTRIDFEWPQANLNMTMQLGQIEVNPQRIPKSTWTVPQIDGYEVRHLNH